MSKPEALERLWRVGTVQMGRRSSTDLEFYIYKDRVSHACDVFISTDTNRVRLVQGDTLFRRGQAILRSGDSAQTAAAILTALDGAPGPRVEIVMVDNVVERIILTKDEL